MKKLLLALAFAVAAAGCAAFQDELPGRGDGDVEKGCIKVELVEGGPFTKGDIPLEASVIGDVNIYIFNEEGSLLRRGFFPDGNMILEEMEISSGTGYTVYALANWGEECAVATIGELEELVCSAEDVVEIEGSPVGSVMHGKLENVKISLREVLRVPMQRILGKIEVVCDFSALGAGVSVEVKEIAIRNVPVMSALFRENVASEVAAGKVRSGEELSAISSEGVVFYMFENVQGSVPGATDNKSKASLMGEGKRALCTYIEMKCYLVTNEHRGDMIYRFYLGTQHSDCNVFRNAVQKMKVRFKGNASQDEYSVSVDNSALQDRVTTVIVNPAVAYFSPGVGKKVQCRVEAQPATAADKRIVWESTDTGVAVVDQNGLVTTTGPGPCRIIGRSVDNPNAFAFMEVYVMFEDE